MPLCEHGERCGWMFPPLSHGMEARGQSLPVGSLFTLRTLRRSTLHKCSMDAQRSSKILILSPKLLFDFVYSHAGGVGASCKVSLTGTIRFLGRTEFAPGDWVGVELDRPIGKNDGSLTLGSAQGRAWHKAEKRVTRTARL